MEMKADVTRLPNELAKIPSVSHQLKMDEISTLSKLASKGTIATSHTHSVITQAPSVVTMATSGSSSAASGADKQKATSKPATVAGKSETIIVQKEQTAKYGVAYAPGTTIVQAPVQLATGSGLAVPAGDGVVVYTMASNTGGTQYATIQQQSGSAQTSTSSSNQTQTTYAIGVPTYVDGNMYLQGQTVQLVPVSSVSASNQQVVYWPVQQGSQTSAASQPTAVAVGPQLAVVQGSSPAVLQPVQYVVDNKTSIHHSTSDSSTVSKASIITID